GGDLGAELLGEAFADGDGGFGATGLRVVGAAHRGVVDHGDRVFDGAVGAAERAQSFERDAAADGRAAVLVELGAREAHREQQENVVLRQVGGTGEVDLQVFGVAVGVQVDAPLAAHRAGAHV